MIGLQIKRYVKEGRRQMPAPPIILPIDRMRRSIQPPSMLLAVIRLSSYLTT